MCNVYPLCTYLRYAILAIAGLVSILGFIYGVYLITQNNDERYYGTVYVIITAISLIILLSTKKCIRILCCDCCRCIRIKSEKQAEVNSGEIIFTA